MEEIILRADKEHKGIEVLVPLCMFFSGILFFLLIDSVVLRPMLDGTDWDGFRGLFRVVLSVILGVLIGAVLELLLKRVWPSGRFLRVDAEGVPAVAKAQTTVRIDWDKRVNLLRWRFLMTGYSRGGRERRVTNGHLMMAVRLLQDEKEIIAHCYFSAKQAQQTPGYGRFVGIDMAALFDKGILKRLGRPGRPMIGKELLAGQQRQVWLAEKTRWALGFELEPADFSTFVEALKRHAGPAAP